ncbi:hypothetical protein HanIR_Chr05g0214671 [Helianthus annuus]|nr:hypothetical protein HanIR_Chr05g0214671 [Helianthus annuus]
MVVESINTHTPTITKNPINKYPLCNIISSTLIISLFLLFFLILSLLISGGILILLIFRYQIIHVALGLRELHLIHSFTSVPMQKRLPPEHSRKLLTHTSEHFLNRRRVTNEGRRHFQTSRWDVTNG